VIFGGLWLIDKERGWLCINWLVWERGFVTCQQRNEL